MEIERALTALADPTRLAIVTRLAEEGETDATELARPFEISQPAVSRHIRLLAEAGWVTQRRVGTRRPVRLSGERLTQLHQWSAGLLQIMEANYARLDQILEKDE